MKWHKPSSNAEDKKLFLAISRGKFLQRCLAIGKWADNCLLTMPEAFIVPSDGCAKALYWLLIFQ